LGELQASQAVAMLETYYGSSWKPPGVGSRNWGATQVPAGSDRPCFSYQDHHGDGTAYQACFGIYETDEEGIEAYLRAMWRRREAMVKATASGRIRNVAAVMRAGHYFEAGLDKYTDALSRNVAEIADRLEEPNAFGKRPGSVLGTLLLAVPVVTIAVGLAAKRLR
jgi:hypothetical protein